MSVSSVTALSYPSSSPSTRLSYAQARSTLQTLVPGSEEYLQLQQALIKGNGIVEVYLKPHIYKIDMTTKDGALLGGFGSSEHIAIGAEVKLPEIPSGSPLMHGFVHFRHIIALAGDFYGVINQPISLCLEPNGTTPTQRFLAAFDSLLKGDIGIIRKLVRAIDQEHEDVKHASLPHHCYRDQMMERDHAYEQIKSDIGRLLIDNSDHFSANAVEAYLTGHAAAIRLAQEAGRKKDSEGLKFAYAHDAFACHFLTDLFSAGHVRNQRGLLEKFLLEKLKFSAADAKSFAGLLTAAQHEEDGSQGVNVSNGKGESWKAYGDGCFFTPENQENKTKVITAVQESINELYRAYQNPDSPLETQMEQFIPKATERNQLPVYFIGKDELVVYMSGQPRNIGRKEDWMEYGIAQALRYLPQKYIMGFVDAHCSDFVSGFVEAHCVPKCFPKFDFTPAQIVVNQCVLPSIERLTGSIWHIVGVATYHQIAENAEQINEKIKEMAGNLQAIQENTISILSQINKIQAEDKWKQSHNEIHVALCAILTRSHEYSTSSLNEEQKKRAAYALWDAYQSLSRVFSQGTVENLNILDEYRKILLNRQHEPAEIQMEVTRWFRSMLDYEIQAFSLYAVITMMREDKGGRAVIKDQFFAFQASLSHQVRNNKEHIDIELICKSRSYIDLQIEKNKTRKTALKLMIK